MKGKNMTALPEIPAHGVMATSVSYLSDYNQKQKSATAVIDGCLVSLKPLTEELYTALAYKLHFRSKFPGAVFVPIHNERWPLIKNFHYGVVTAPQRDYVTKLHFFRAIGGGNEIVFHSPNASEIERFHTSATENRFEKHRPR